MKSNELRILIVDDDEVALMELEHILEGEGYITETAWSGQEALRLSDAGQFNLFLIDEHLSDVNSTLLATKLRQLQPTAPLLLMCGHASSKSMPSSSGYPAVCKWEHDAVKERVRGFLAA